MLIAARVGLRLSPVWIYGWGTHGWRAEHGHFGGQPVWGDWRAGLYAVLAMNLAVGALFAYAGIYYGGTLPFVAPGPNAVEVARSLIPQYLATSALLLGVLFAWKLRQAGQAGGVCTGGC